MKVIIIKTIILTLHTGLRPVSIATIKGFVEENLFDDAKCKGAFALRGVVATEPLTLIALDGVSLRIFGQEPMTEHMHHRATGGDDFTILCER